MRKVLIGLSLLLTACGGGGGSGGDGGGTGPGVTTPPPTSPAPAPPPPDEVSSFDTAEYQQNWGLEGSFAAAAYDDGLSGAGQVVAVIDTGIDIDQADLDDNIHAASKDIYDGASNTLTNMLGMTSTFSSLRSGGGSLDDIDGHGTLIAGLIAAEKNDYRGHGIAFEAQVLALRTDEPASCPDDCLFDDNAIAASVNYAIANGARIINISLGGGAPNSNLAGALRDAVQAGALIVISAGNAPEDEAPYSPSANPDLLALLALETWANGQVIIAGAADEFGVISDFSSRAGIGAAVYLLAPGENVFSTTVIPGTGETAFAWGDGTSFASPHIAGAAALLMEKFPALTAAQVVDILLTSATDLGNPLVNGHGHLNIAAAIAPIGPSSLGIKLAGGIVSVDPALGGLVVGGAFGDGLGLAGRGVVGGGVFTDVYNRAYTTQFENQIILTDPQVNLAGWFESMRTFEQATLDTGAGTQLHFSSRYHEGPTRYEERVLGLSGSEGAGLESVSVRMVTRLDKRTSVTAGFGGALDAVLDGASSEFDGSHGVHLGSGARLAWLSRSAGATGRSGFTSGGKRFGAAWDLNNGGALSIGVAQDDIEAPYASFWQAGRGQVGEASRTLMAARYAYQASSGGRLVATLVQAEETGTVLGSFSSGVLGLGKGAQSWFGALEGTTRGYKVGDARLSAFGLGGIASVMIDEDSGSAFSNFDNLTATQFAIGARLDGLIVADDRLSVTVSQPLRLESGTAVSGLASGYDYDVMTYLFQDTPQGLAPTGREIDVELAWQFAVSRYGFGEGGARFSANVLWQSQPGHVRARDDEVTFMFSGRSAF